MKRLHFVMTAIIILFPYFFKAQRGEIVWERGGEIGASSFSFLLESSEFIVMDRNSEIAIRNTGTGLVVRKFALSSSDSRAAWSPGADQLAVLTQRYVGNSPEPALLLMDAGDGRILQEIIPYYGDIAFSPNPGLLKISIHDIFGREVAVLKNEFSEPGSYTLPFRNNELINGTYFLELSDRMESSTTSFQILR
jgi:hypothetical protein